MSIPRNCISCGVFFTTYDIKKTSCEKCSKENNTINMCKWFKKNQFYYYSDCGLELILHPNEMGEIVYCRRCGKKVEIV